MSLETLERPPAAAASRLRVVAPLSGQVWPLERVPDPVFAQKMVGDGLSIDPTDAVLVAACDGEVVALHAAGHAVTLRTPEGIELLMHIGIDTVALKGEGFRPRVKVGDRVRAGDAADRVRPRLRRDARQEPADPDRRRQQRARDRRGSARAGSSSAGKDTLFTITFARGRRGGCDATAATRPSRRRPIVIPNPTGLHARPAAVLANLAKGFESAIKLQLRRPAGQRAKRHGDHGAGSVARGEGAGGGQRSRCGGGRREARRGARRKAAATRVARPRRRRRRRPSRPPAAPRRRGASPTTPTCCSAWRRRPGWRSARCSRSAARRSRSRRRARASMPSAAGSSPRSRRRRDSSPRCARNCTPRPSPPRPRSSPRTRSCCPTRTCSTSSSPPSPRARARRSRGSRRSRRTPTGWPGCATSCSRSAPTTCATSACACCRS